jgi:hypothetical protein
VDETVAKDFVGLADALERLHEELATAQARSADQPLQFKIREAQITFDVAIELEAGPEGGFRLGVVTLQGSAKRRRGSTQTLTLTMEVVDARTGRPSKVGDKSGLPMADE